VLFKFDVLYRQNRNTMFFSVNIEHNPIYFVKHMLKKKNNIQLILKILEYVSKN